jgi:hypothetical protein
LAGCLDELTEAHASRVVELVVIEGAGDTRHGRDVGHIEALHPPAPDRAELLEGKAQSAALAVDLRHVWISAIGDVRRWRPWSGTPGNRVGA